MLLLLQLVGYLLYFLTVRETSHLWKITLLIVFKYALAKRLKITLLSLKRLNILLSLKHLCLPIGESIWSKGILVLKERLIDYLLYKKILRIIVIDKRKGLSLIL